MNTDNNKEENPDAYSEELDELGNDLSILDSLDSKTGDFEDLDLNDDSKE